MTLRPAILILLSVFALQGFSQTQTIKGTIIEAGSGIPLPFANVILLNTNSNIGTTSDEVGNFIIRDVPIGRYDIQASFVGYESSIKKDIEVTSSRAIQLEFILQESFSTLEEVVVKPNIDKEQALNSMALISARMLSVEEANRYAGGFDDPARLASSFAGVSSGVNNNGIVVRGNAPKSLQWKLEGIEIPNPNHFADLASFGGGALTALSSQLLANSDFLTGAFPSEYSNALSGVFDIKMRKGNNENREHTFQLGALGIDFSSEGPFKKGKQASYLFNYRYSTFGLVGKITGAEEGIEYQDLSFKLNFPTKKAGVFSVWGIGLLDGIIVSEEPDSSNWEYETDGERYDADQYMLATGINHKLILNNRAYLQSTFALTTSQTDLQIRQLDNSLILQDRSNVLTTNSTFVFKTTLNSKLNKKHTNRTGFLATRLDYKTLLQNRFSTSSNLQTLVNENGNSLLLTAFTSSNLRVSDKFTFNLGINTQLFTLNNNYTVEPRLALKWDINTQQNLGLAYGLHSRLEKLNYYFTKDEMTNTHLNKDLDFTKSHHFVISYSLKLSDFWLFKIEPYYQFLFDVPVIRNSYFYSMLTASVFNSEYLDGLDVWRNTRFNKNYILNLLAGKEWYFGENNRKIFGVNIRMTAQGGDRYVPYFEQESINTQNVIFDYNNAFSEKFDPNLILHFSTNYKINKEKTTHEFALKILNATGYGDFQGFKYNQQTMEIDETSEVIFIPNLSYKISF